MKHTSDWRKYFKGFYYDEASQIIMHENGMFLNLRGWGWLTGQAANKLQHEVAAKIQDAAGRDVAAMLNHHDSLVSLLKRARGPLAVQAHPDHNPQIFEIVQDIDNELKSLGHE